MVGGGIAGLSAAYTLAESSRRGRALACTLIEAAPRLGGKILTERTEGYVIEGGPDSFLSHKPWAIELCRALGLEDHLIGTNAERRKTFVYSKGRLHELPEGLAMGLPTKLAPFLRSGLLSWPAKVRLGAELFVPPRRDEGDEALGAFFRRRFGAEVSERVVEPLMTGIFAGDADRLSILATFPRFPEMERASGSVIKSMLVARWNRPVSARGEGARWTPFVTLRGGLTQVVEAATARLADVRLVTGRRVTGIRVRERGGYEVLIEGQAPLEAEALVLATPAYDAAALLESFKAPLAGLLRGIPYVSTATVSLGFRREHFAHALDGYGLVIPRVEGRRLLASTWTSSKWAGRAPDGSVLIRSYIGGTGREALLEQPDDDVIELVRGELREVMGITEKPALARIYRWPRSMPQYLVGHLDRVAAIERELVQAPGLYLAGAAYRGVGIPDCIRDGVSAAQRICAYFDKAPSRSV